VSVTFDVSNHPTFQQRQAIEHSPSPLMIMAGAGTGKTFTLVKRIVHLIENKSIDPFHILMITYTERAARELKEKVVSEVGQPAEKMTVGTFHSVCYQTVKEFGNVSPTPRLLDESEAIYMLLDTFDDLGPFESTEFALEPEKAVVKSFLPFFSRCRDELLDPAGMPDPQNETDTEVLAQIRDLRRIYGLYQAMKKDLDTVDYGDMILQAHELLQSDEIALKACRDRFRHIIVDEFQDNNFALNKIVGLLAHKRQSVTVVGDDDQVIYSFRGASAYNIKAFEDSYGSQKDFLATPLETNFRSHQQILDVANDIIKHNDDRQAKLLKAEGERKGPRPTLIWTTKIEQPIIIIDQIYELLSEGFSFEDIAVLSRTRNQAKSLADSFLGANIPTQADFRHFFEIPEIKTLVAWCQVVGEGKHKETALYRLVREASNNETAYELFSRFDTRDLTPRIQLLPSLNGTLPPEARALFTQVEELKKLSKKKNAGEMLWEICERTALLRPLAKRYHYEDQLALINIGNLLKKAQEFSRDRENERGLHRFNLYLESMMTASNRPAHLPSPVNSNAVTVQTIHGVKGGEFPVVFVPFNRSGSFPLSFRREAMVSRPPDEWIQYAKHSTLSDRDHHLQEERRLMYVAVTRAQEKLFLLAPSKATSLFVKKLDKSLVHEINSEIAVTKDKA